MRLETGLVIAMTAVGLVACQQRVDGSSAAAYSKSLTAMVEKLPAEKKPRFKEALIAIASDSGEPNETFFKDAEPDSLIMFSAAPKIKGKTANQIIKLGYETETKNLNEAIAQDLGTIQRLKVEQAKYAAVFSNIHIDGARYHVRKEMFEVQPLLSMRITNNSNIAIKTIYLHCRLISPGREVPWIDQDVNTDFVGGLEPGESKNLDLAPNPFGDWRADDSFAGRPDLKLDVTLVNIENAAGEKLISADLNDASEKQTDLAKKLKELKVARSNLAES